MNIFAFVIGLVVVVLTMVFAFLLVIINESKKPRNKVRFYITRHKLLGLGQSEWILWLGKPYLSNSGIYVSKFEKGVVEIANNTFINRFGLKSEDYARMKDGDIREVFLNLED